MRKNYGIALIGSGDRGRRFSSTFKEIDGIRFVSVCDLMDDRLRKAQDGYGYSHACKDYKEAIMHEGVDIVVICTPVCTHHDISVFAMEHGKHVLMEKSMALSLTDAEDMIKTAERNNVMFSLAFQYPNIKRWRAVKHVMENEMIGRPVLMHFSDYRQIRPKTAMHDALNGNGGPMVDMACHFYDLMHWYFDSEPVSVSAKKFTFTQDRPEIAHIENKAPDTAVITVEFASKDVGVVTVCWGLPPGVNSDAYQSNAIGPKGMLMETVSDADEVRCMLEGGIIEKIELSGQELEETANPELTLVKRFIKSIEGEGELQRTGKDGMRALAVSLASIKSADEGRTVMIDEIFKVKPAVIDVLQPGK